MGVRVAHSAGSEKAAGTETSHPGSELEPLGSSLVFPFTWFPGDAKALGNLR